MEENRNNNSQSYDYYPEENVDTTEYPRGSSYKRAYQRSKSGEINPSKTFTRILVIGAIISLIILGIAKEPRILWLGLLIIAFILVLSVIISIFRRIFSPDRVFSFWDIIFLDDFIELLFFLGRLIIILAIEIIKDN